MKRAVQLLVFNFILLGFTKAQFNQLGRYLVIRNSAPYRGWFRVFNDFKQDSAFQAALFVELV